MNTITTNRGMYLAIADLTTKNRSGTRDLEQYLLALWGSARQFRDQPSLTPEEFFGLLAEAFTLAAPEFVNSWRSMTLQDTDDPLVACLAAKLGIDQQGRGTDGARFAFDRWESFLLRQVVDLREMAESGMFEDKMRYFGINSPRGQRWYNFDPCTFLECATAGVFDGWQAGDDTGREYVPGPVAVMGGDGMITSVDPHDVPDLVVSLQEVSWDDFRSFLGCGQWYE